MKLSKIYFLLICLCIPLVANAEQKAQHLPPSPFPLQIYSPLGVKKADIIIEVARTIPQQRKGLMHRAPLSQNTGMLFPSVHPRVKTFWMKNTPASLDIIFIQPDKTIGMIHTHTKPNSTQIYSSKTKAIATLELKAGETQRLGLETGDHVNHPDLDIKVGD